MQASEEWRDHDVRYAPLSRFEDCCRLGWLPIPALIDTHHGEHAMAMKWIDCECGKSAPWIQRKAHRSEATTTDP